LRRLLTTANPGQQVILRMRSGRTYVGLHGISGAQPDFLFERCGHACALKTKVEYVPHFRLRIHEMVGFCQCGETRWAVPPTLARPSRARDTAEHPAHATAVSQPRGLPR
jgi:hypothetical protein